MTIKETSTETLVVERPSQKLRILAGAGDDLALKPDDEELNLMKEKSDKQLANESQFKAEILWFPNVAWYVALHLGALVGLYLMITQASWPTVAFSFVLYVLGGLGITAGAHRLWSHRTYKASLPYRIFMMLCNCLAMQNDVIEWARDHRCHHKWTETDADPHNTNRGMFFAHMGWLMMRKHPEVKRKGSMLDLSDLTSDPVLMFQRKYYTLMSFGVCFGLPTVIPMMFWGEGLMTSYLVAGIFRYVFLLHITWCVNSLAHWMGDRPYDERIRPSESLLTAMGALGEGWHNYHHTFPQDYKTAEVPYMFNFTTVVIDIFALLGWTYDRKVATKEMIERQKGRFGHSHTKH